MDVYSLSNKAIVEELGNRLKTLRLRKNLSQQALADATTLSVSTIKSLEQGHGKLTNLVAVLRALRSLDQLDQFLPDIPISPLQLMKMRGRQRQRASGLRARRTIQKQKKDNQ